MDGWPKEWGKKDKQNDGLYNETSFNLINTAIEIVPTFNYHVISPANILTFNTHIDMSSKKLKIKPGSLKMLYHVNV